jgi:hypothetical protein
MGNGGSKVRPQAGEARPITAEMDDGGLAGSRHRRAG